MRVIHVHFDAAHNSVAVLPAAEVVFAGDEVVWEVSSTGRSIARVELEIKKKTKFSFGGSVKASYSQKLLGGKTRIHGVAPHVKKGRHARYEYTVRGIRGKGKPPIELDPVIIIVPPEPTP
jgi:hypothetical protein